MGTKTKVALIGSLAMVAGITAMQNLGSELQDEFAAQAVVEPMAELTAAGGAENVSDPVEKTGPFAHPVEACKATIALINDRDPSSMRGSKLSDGLVHVTWRSPDDGKRWQARCEMIGNDQLRWAAFDAFGDGQQGRWRSEDSVEVSVSDGQLHINLDQSGVIKKQESYLLSALS